MLHAIAAARPGGIVLFAHCKFALVFMLLALPCFAATQDSPVLGDGSGAYKTHEYCDLFAEQGHPPAETRAKMDKAFQQLFHGDGQEQRPYFETESNEDGPLAYITDWANNDARSEGMSYGMMIAVQMDKKREFDALWNWSNTYMLITD
jgi:oligosaccharide reducing-end xylanase